MTASIAGTSTRKVDDLVKALGCDSGVSKSTVSRICQDIDEDVTELRARRLDGIPFASLPLDAAELKVGENRRVVSKAVVIATAVCGAMGIVRLSAWTWENRRTRRVSPSSSATSPTADSPACSSSSQAPTAVSPPRSSG